MNYQEQDPQLWAAIAAEKKRQQGNIELIASENIVSEGVLAAQGSVLTNKYAEGYPGKRYYGGCEYIDVVEDLALDRAKALFELNMLMSNRTLAHKLMQLPIVP